MFTYAYEVDLLRVRVEELRNVVHRHFLSVCNTSFSRLSVELDLNFTGLGALAEKVTVVPCDSDYPAGEDPWEREAYSRRHALRAAKLLMAANDILFFSDVDEIPSAVTARELLMRDLGSSIVHLRMPVWRYSFGCLDPDLVGRQERCGAVALSGSRAVQEEGDQLRGYGHECRASGVQLFCAGWHCSSCLPPVLVRQKFAHFSHARDESMKSYNADIAQNITILETSMRQCRSPQGMAYELYDRHTGFPESVWAGPLRYLLPLRLQGLGD